MNPKTSLLAQNLFIKAFTLQIIRNIRESKIDYKFEEKIDAEIIPKFGEKGKASVLEPKKEEKKTFQYAPFPFKKRIYEKTETKKIPSFPKTDGEIPREALVPKKPILMNVPKKPILMNVPKKPVLIKAEPKPVITPEKTPLEKPLTKEIPKEKFTAPPKVIPHPIMKIKSAPLKTNPIIKKPVVHAVKQEVVAENNGYEQLKLLIEDSSVSLIECAGARKPLTIMRKGRKQPTKIILTEADVKKYLKEISEKTHIPLLEGVFRTIVGPLSINAVVSEIIGSKFIIKKHLF